MVRINFSHPKFLFRQSLRLANPQWSKLAFQNSPRTPRPIPLTALSLSTQRVSSTDSPTLSVPGIPKIASSAIPVKAL
jgi:hypothetical protein